MKSCVKMERTVETSKLKNPVAAACNCLTITIRWRERSVVLMSLVDDSSEKNVRS